MNDLEQKIEALLARQKRDWKLAHDNYISLSTVQTRHFQEDGRTTVLQFNPERIRSSAAKIDAVSLRERPCFFCERPAVQESLVYHEFFELMLNPYPIFEDHLTIPLRRHEKQQIRPYYRDMLDLASDLSRYAVFYNGPKCGASAPDHMHFQAGPKSGFPIRDGLATLPKQLILENGHTQLYVSTRHVPVTFFLVSEDRGEATDVFDFLYSRMSIKPDDYEPMMNLLTWKDGKTWTTCIFPRRALRPSCYDAEGDANRLISPATVEMSGLFVVPLEKDFEKVTYPDLTKIWEEVSIAEEEKHELVRKVKTQA